MLVEYGIKLYLAAILKSEIKISGASQVKQVSYTSKNTFESLNELGQHTKYIWIVFHGMGHLSRFFLKYFERLPKDEHFIVAPQAPSKYYMDDRFKNVGASWLTKENTKLDIENVLSYVDAVYTSLEIPDNAQLIVLGFSQGMSIAARWVARSKIVCHKLVFYAGGIPKELKAADFEFLPNSSKVIMIYGDRDIYLTPDRLTFEEARLEELFIGRASKLVFEGGHEILPSQLDRIVKH